MKAIENAASYATFTAAKAALAAERTNSGANSAATKALLKPYLQAIKTCAGEVKRRDLEGYATHALAGM
jgi:hypothetical protein